MTTQCMRVQWRENAVIGNETNLCSLNVGYLATIVNSYVKHLTNINVVSCERCLAKPTPDHLIVAGLSA